MSEFAFKLVYFYSYVGSIEMQGGWELSSLATARKNQGKQTSSKIFCNWHCISELIYFHYRNNHAIKLWLRTIRKLTSLAAQLTSE